jgi:hypothetical protein
MRSADEVSPILVWVLIFEAKLRNAAGSDFSSNFPKSWILADVIPSRRPCVLKTSIQVNQSFLVELQWNSYKKSIL